MKLVKLLKINIFFIFFILIFLATISLSSPVLAKKNSNNLKLSYSTEQINQLQEKLKTKNIPGGVSLIPLGQAINQAFFNHKPLLLIEDSQKKQKYALVGLGLDLKVGRHLMTTNLSPISFLVSNHQYQEQRIQLPKSKQKYVSPPDEVIQRIIAEKERSKKMINIHSNFAPKSLNMILPTQGILTSPFGMQRFFNDKPKNPHNGIDIANDEGTKIYAALDGIVQDVHHYYFNGKTIFIDHGMGLISVYIHLSETNVAIGDKVKQGDEIAKMGQTGRVTGSNLHFGVYLNGNAIDPQIFLTQSK